MENLRLSIQGAILLLVEIGCLLQEYYVLISLLLKKHHWISLQVFTFAAFSCQKICFFKYKLANSWPNASKFCVVITSQMQSVSPKESPRNSLLCKEICWESNNGKQKIEGGQWRWSVNMEGFTILRGGRWVTPCHHSFCVVLFVAMVTQCQVWYKSSHTGLSSMFVTSATLLIVDSKTSVYIVLISKKKKVQKLQLSKMNFAERIYWVNCTTHIHLWFLLSAALGRI